MSPKQLLERIESTPGVMLGKPVIRGTRIPVDLILRKLSQRLAPGDILADYPDLTIDDISAAVLYAAEALSSEHVHFLRLSSA